MWNLAERERDRRQKCASKVHELHVQQLYLESLEHSRLMGCTGAFPLKCLVTHWRKLPILSSELNNKARRKDPDQLSEVHCGHPFRCWWKKSFYCVPFSFRCSSCSTSASMVVVECCTFQTEPLKRKKAAPSASLIALKERFLPPFSVLLQLHGEW